MNTQCKSQSISSAVCSFLTAAALLTAAQPATAQPGWVLSHQKISDTRGRFDGALDRGEVHTQAAVVIDDPDLELRRPDGSQRNDAEQDRSDS